MSSSTDLALDDYGSMYAQNVYTSKISTVGTSINGQPIPLEIEASAISLGSTSSLDVGYLNVHQNWIDVSKGPVGNQVNGLKMNYLDALGYNQYASLSRGTTGQFEFQDTGVSGVWAPVKMKELHVQATDADNNLSTDSDFIIASRYGNLEFQHSTDGTFMLFAPPTGGIGAAAQPSQLNINRIVNFVTDANFLGNASMNTINVGATAAFKNMSVSGLLNLSAGALTLPSSVSMNSVSIGATAVFSGRTNLSASIVTFPSSVSMGNVSIGSMNTLSVTNISGSGMKINGSGTYPTYIYGYTQLYLNGYSSAATSNATTIGYNSTNTLYIKGLSAGSLSVSSTGLVTSASDQRLKTEIAVVSEPDIIAKLQQIPVKSYRFKTDMNQTRIGFIAQDVETVFPHVVDGKKYEYEIKKDETTGEYLFDANGQPIYELDDHNEKIIRPRGFDATAMTAYILLGLQQVMAQQSAMQQQLNQLQLVQAAGVSPITQSDWDAMTTKVNHVTAAVIALGGNPR